MRITITSATENAEPTYATDGAVYNAFLLEAIAEIHVLKMGCCDESGSFKQQSTSCLENQFFSRPLVMLNFEKGKNRLVNVCPYCSHVLGNAENEQIPKSDFQIADADKKLTH